MHYYLAYLHLQQPHVSLPHRLSTSQAACAVATTFVCPRRCHRPLSLSLTHTHTIFLNGRLARLNTMYMLHGRTLSPFNRSFIPSIGRLAWIMAK